MNPESQDAGLEQLFLAALGVLNRALDTHRGSAPYQTMLAEYTERLQDRPLGVQLYVDNPSEPVVHFAVRFRNGLFEPVSADQPVEGSVWKIGVEKLREIVADENQHVSDPDALFCDWLANQIEATSS